MSERAKKVAVEDEVETTTKEVDYENFSVDQVNESTQEDINDYFQRKYGFKK